MGPKDASKYVIGNLRNFGRDPEKDQKAAAGAGVGAAGAGAANGGVANGATSEHVEAVGKQTRMQKTKQHCGRFWCCYLIGTVVFLAIFLPVFFMVAVPAIAQRMVEDADLPLHSASLFSPTPDTIDYNLTASIKVPPPFTVHLEALDLDLYNPETGRDTNYVTISLPGQNIKGNATISVSDQTVDILNEDEFIKFLDDAVRLETVVIAAVGQTKAKIGALNADIELDKHIEVYALNSFKGYSIKSARVLIPPGDDGAMMAGVLNMPNASPVTIGLGNLTLNVFVSGYAVGLARLYDVVLEPGDNEVDARIDANLGVLMDNLSDILEKQSEPLGRGNISLSSSGNSTIFNGQHIHYLESVLNNFELNTEVSVSSVISDSATGLLGGSSDFLDSIMGTLNSTGIGSLLSNSGLLDNLLPSKRSEIEDAL